MTDPDITRQADLKALAQSPAATQRAEAASAEDAPPELLYYLTTDRDENVRQAAAGNAATPLQTAPLLVQDESRMVRAALARKLGRVLPTMPEGMSRKSVLEALETLGHDTAADVRAAVAVTLRDTAFLPPALARSLAEDSEREVASPVLRFSLSLSDKDLIELVRGAKREWVPVEVAHRKVISNDVAMAVWESGNQEAAAVLLSNRGAETSPAILDEAIEEAVIVTELQPPLARHPQLSSAQLERLAIFVDGSLLETLASRAQLDRGTLSDVSAVIRRRLDWAAWRKKGGSGAERAQALFKRRELDDAAVSDAVAWGERDFVVTALALLAKTQDALVEKVLAHQSPKGITALCWKAGIAMRTCRMLQIRIARVPVMKALYARGGTDYPLSAADLKWQLEFYGIVPVS